MGHRRWRPGAATGGGVRARLIGGGVRARPGQRMAATAASVPPRQTVPTSAKPAAVRADRARPTHDRVLTDALAEAQATPELAPLVDALHRLPAVR
ncbi:hypothetical protein ACLQ24_14940 [Micromonospora sp. DT4]|uniref:hypothetical protein n=1 Tax=Micromonospora sp. DT4 TaxID=3393438 RepID=UPI003CF9AD01